MNIFGKGSCQRMVNLHSYCHNISQTHLLCMTRTSIQIAGFRSCVSSVIHEFDSHHFLSCFRLASEWGSRLMSRAKCWSFYRVPDEGAVGGGGGGGWSRLKFRENKSNNVFREILNCFRKTTKFKFFSQNKLYIWYLQITRFKMIYNMFVF